MTEDTSPNKFNKYISVALIVVIIVSVGIFAYTNFIKKEPTTSDNNLPPNTQLEKTLLTITVGSQSYNYTLNNLTALGSITSQGSYINKAGKITGPNNYTGVSMSMLLNSISTLPTNYTVHVVASDEYARNFSIDEVNGHIPVFNETGAEIGTENLIMIIAYKVDDILLNETTKGPLRIAFIGPQSAITNSGLWVSSLVKIELI
jgi:hypothetical protein